MPSGSAWERRPTLTMWVYDSVLGAAAGQVRLDALVRRRAVDVRDAVIVAWVPGAHRPRIDGIRQPAAGLIDDPVLMRLVRLIAESAGGGLDAPAPTLPEVARRIRGTGLGEAVLADMQGAMEPGRSALVVYAVGADLDVIRAVIERGRARGDVRLIFANLAPDAEGVLRRALVEGS